MIPYNVIFLPSLLPHFLAWQARLVPYRQLRARQCKKPAVQSGPQSSHTLPSTTILALGNTLLTKL